MIKCETFVVLLFLARFQTCSAADPSSVAVDLMAVPALTETITKNLVLKRVCCFAAFLSTVCELLPLFLRASKWKRAKSSSRGADLQVMVK
jgi:hypothetical protein